MGNAIITFFMSFDPPHVTRNTRPSFCFSGGSGNKAKAVPDQITQTLHYSNSTLMHLSYAKFELSGDLL